MYIEFQLPTGAGGMAAQYANGAIGRNLREWAERYDVAYTKKIHKWTVRVTFEDEKNYSLFAMTWNPQSEHMTNYLKKFKLVEPMARPE